MKIKDSFHTYAIITIIFWSLAYVLTRVALRHFTPYSLGFLRYFIASCTIIAVIFILKMKPPKKADVIWFVLSGAVGFFLYMIVFNKGCKTVTASTSSVIIATVPVITSMLAYFIYKERLKRFQWAAIIISFLGVVVLTMSKSIFTINKDLFLIMAAAVFLSLYNILQRKLTKVYSPLQTSAYSIFAGTAMLFIFSPAAVEEVKSADVTQLLIIVILGVFSSAIAYVSWTKAFAKAKYTSSVSNYMFVTPFFTTLLGFMIAGEAPDYSTVSGGIVILTGLLIFSFGGRRGSNLSIRKVESHELDSCAEVIRKSFAAVAEEFNLSEENCPTNGAFVKTDRLMSDMSDGKHMYGLFNKNSLIGFFELEDIGAGRFALEKLAVLPAFRHKGYGTFMLDYAKIKVAEIGGTAITIGIIEQNTILKDWYSKYGFVHTGTKKFHHLPFLVGFMEMSVKT